MNDNQNARPPQQPAQDGPQRHPEQQHQQKHHDPRGHDGGNLATQTPKGGVSQDGFGQSGDQGTPDQTDHNLHTGG
jgi:hypothetical protein